MEMNEQAPEYSVALSDVIAEFNLRCIHLPDQPEKILISNKGVNRPGLQLAGFYDHYESKRIQIIGKVEYLYSHLLFFALRNSVVKVSS